MLALVYMQQVCRSSAIVFVALVLPFVVAAFALPPGMFPPPSPAGPPPGYVAPEEEADDDSIDFAMSAVGQPQRAKQGALDGIRIPFTIHNNGTKTYQAEIQLICSDFEREESILASPGTSNQFIFHPLQEASYARYEGMADFRAGKKTEQCSLAIANIHHPDFDDLDEPTDSDISNNGFLFTLGFNDQRPSLREVRAAALNTSQRVKQLRLPLSPQELEAYKTLAKEQCLHILLASDDRGFYYNGEPMDPEWEGPGGPKIRDAHIAGDRLGYAKDAAVILNGEDVGLTNTSGATGIGIGSDIQLKLNEKHFAYFQLVGYNASQRRSTYHLIYDGKDLGPASMFDARLNGDFVIYHTVRGQYLKSAQYQLFVNGKKIANGAFGDYDGKNLAYVAASSHGHVVYNGKKKGYGTDITLKDGHFAFTRGETVQGVNPRIIYDGKNLGRGRNPVIEKQHLAFFRARSEIDARSKDQHPRVIYDGKELGYVGGTRWQMSLTGDHLAYMRRLPEQENPFIHPVGFVRININGKDYPGDFLDQRVYIEIQEKKDQSVCKR